MKNKVYISYNDDAGVWQWSIGLTTDWGNWINSFPTEKEAIKFCNDNDYEIVRI